MRLDADRGNFRRETTMEKRHERAHTEGKSRDTRMYVTTTTVEKREQTFPLDSRSVEISKKKKKRRAYTRLFNERERILIGNCYRRFSLASANKVRVIRRQRYSTNETRSSLVFLRRDSPRVCRVTFSPAVSGKGRKINNRQRRQRQTSKTFRPIG